MSKSRKPVPNFESGWDEKDEAKYAEGAAERAEAAADLAPAIKAAIDDRPKLDFAESVLGNLADDAPGYQTNHIELNNLSAAERDFLARLRVGLAERHAVLASGKHVEGAAHAVRWLIQQAMLLAMPQVRVADGAARS
jgi:hypothetical protein